MGPCVAISSLNLGNITFVFMVLLERRLISSQFCLISSRDLRKITSVFMRVSNLVAISSQYRRNLVGQEPIKARVF